jgi:hypothetical protein
LWIWRVWLLGFISRIVSRINEGNTCRASEVKLNDYLLRPLSRHDECDLQEARQVIPVLASRLFPDRHRCVPKSPAKHSDDFRERMSVRRNLEIGGELDAKNDCLGFRWITEQVDDLCVLEASPASTPTHQPLRPSWHPAQLRPAQQG